MSHRKFLPYGKQFVDADDISAVVEALQQDYLTTGPAVSAFESAFAARVGARHAVACANGTAALHLAALALGLGPGDAVIVPSLTFLATANAARFVGADVVFADVDPSTGLLTPDGVEEALQRCGTLRARAVFPVHLNGQPCDMAGISAIAERSGMAVVEDACHALGGSIGTSVVGDCAYSKMACFSMHPVKAIAMGEGGVVTTNDDATAKRLAAFRSHGMTRDPAAFQNKALAFGPDGTANPWYYEMPEIGFNYRASDVNCALGSSQLKKLDRFVAHRRYLAQTYDRQLAALAPLVVPVPRVAHGSSGWHLYAVQMDFSTAGIARGALMRALQARGVGTQVHYIPVHLQPYYRHRYGNLDLPGAQSYYDRTLSLPLHYAMEDADAAFVAQTLAEILEK